MGWQVCTAQVSEGIEGEREKKNLAMGEGGRDGTRRRARGSLGDERRGACQESVCPSGQRAAATASEAPRADRLQALSCRPHPQGSGQPFFSERPASVQRYLQRCRGSHLDNLNLIPFALQTLLHHINNVCKVKIQIYSPPPTAKSTQNAIYFNRTRHWLSQALGMWPPVLFTTQRWPKSQTPAFFSRGVRKRAHPSPVVALFRPG